MKKFFRFFGVALLATSLCLVSCGKDEEDETTTDGTEQDGGGEEPTTGVTVNFGGTEWTANFIKCVTNGTAFNLYATSAESLSQINCTDDGTSTGTVLASAYVAEPLLRVAANASAAGTITGASDDYTNCMVEYMATTASDLYFLQDEDENITDYLGYQQNTITINVTAISSESISGTITGSMYHLIETTDGISFDAASATDIKNISVTFTNINMQTSSK